MLAKLLHRNAVAPVFYFGDMKCAATILQYRERKEGYYTSAL